MPNTLGCLICGKDRRSRCVCSPGTVGSLREHDVNPSLQTKTANQPRRLTAKETVTDVSKQQQDDAPLTEVFGNLRAAKEEDEQKEKAKEVHGENSLEKACKKTKERTKQKGKGIADGDEDDTKKDARRKQ